MQGNDANWKRLLPFPGFAAGVALTTAFSLLTCRTLILWPVVDAASPLQSALMVAGAAAQDWLLVAGIFGLAIALWFAAGEGRAMAGRIILGAALLAVALAGVANVAAVATLDGPLTLDMLTFPDAPSVGEGISALAGDVTARRVLVGILGLTLFAALSYSLAFAVVYLAENGKAAILSIIAALCGFAICAGLGLNFLPAAASRSSNAVLAFAASVVRAAPSGPGMDTTMAATAGPLLDKGNFTGTAAIPVPRPDADAAGIRNVLIVVMASTSSRIVTGYDGPYSVTPNFARYVDEMGLQVSDAYAHSPDPGLSLISIAGGHEPDLWSPGATETAEDLAGDGLAFILGAQGYRTGFFDSGDGRFQNIGGLAAATGFEVVRDSRDWTCDLGGIEDSPGKDTARKHDICAARAVNDWIGLGDGKPFLAVFRTGMARSPYFPGTNATAYSEDPEFNNHLNAAFSSDQALAETVEHLRKHDLLDETLIVVVGDHGEAFGEHGQYGHATGLWDENIHIPMAFLNPRLFPKGQKIKLIASLDDVAPSVADLLGLAPAPGWTGASLFSEGRSTGVFLFTTWGGFRAGFRDGDRKYFFTANTGEEYLYDLAADPAERMNLALTDPAAARRARDDLSRWISWQTAHRSGSAGLDRAPGGSEVAIMATGTSYLSAPAAQVLLDGKEVGQFEVTTALKTDTAAVDDEAILASFTTLRLPVDPAPCPRVLEIAFLNDEWEGEGQTGDTDLIIDKVSFAGRTYSPDHFRLITPGAGVDFRGAFRLSRNGSIAIDLAPNRACLTASIAAP